MNNAKLAMDSIKIAEEKNIDRTPFLRQKEKELQEIINAIEGISESEYWHTLRKYVFEGLVESLNKRLGVEKEEIEIYRLQGQIIWATKFCDFSSFEEIYKKELLSVRNQINNG